MKKNLIIFLSILLMSTALLLSGCTTTDDSSASSETAPTDDTSHATPGGEGWMISVNGVRADEVWESNFEQWKDTPESAYGDYEFERKGAMVAVKAMPVIKIVAMIDDTDGSMPYSFREALWTEGYDLTFTAADGYSATINTADHRVDELYIADFMDGENITPMICGNVSSKIWVKDLAEISADLRAPSLENNDFELLLEIGSKTGVYKISELENLDYYIEDRGNYTNSYNNTFEFTWAGVKVVDLINEYTSLTKEMSITIEAMDGYAMSYSGDQLLDNADGDWILAFKEDGAYMPEDPGYIRLVKVGPKNPNFTGHVSARMVKKIIIKDVSFKNFDLE
ncbi:MAG TPA: hypothetical protein DCO79_07830, partial [Spirochaeta sp.]|nr:hypothetical protein [Spirochaeta sp.]